MVLVMCYVVFKEDLNTELNCFFLNSSVHIGNTSQKYALSTMSVNCSHIGQNATVHK